MAVRSFSELGCEGTTTAVVARAAGMTQPLVHHHFGSTEGLWRAAMLGQGFFLQTAKHRKRSAAKQARKRG